MYASVHRVEFHYTGDQSLLQVEMFGVPTDILDKARNICGEILGDASWHFISIQMTPPQEIDAVNADREWTGIFQATYK